MKILIIIIIVIVGFLYLLRKHMINYFNQKLKDINEGNLGE